MGWSYNQRKWRDTIRSEYTAETGCFDFSTPQFEDWLVSKGHLSEETSPDTSPPQFPLEGSRP